MNNDGNVRITSPYYELHERATCSVSGYLREAVGEIDAQFGRGYAAKNPTLVAAFLTATATDYSTASRSKEAAWLIDSLGSIASSIDNVAEALEKITSNPLEVRAEMSTATSSTMLRASPSTSDQ